CAGREAGYASASFSAKLFEREHQTLQQQIIPRGDPLPWLKHRRRRSSWLWDSVFCAEPATRGDGVDRAPSARRSLAREAVAPAQAKIPMAAATARDPRALRGVLRRLQLVRDRLAWSALAQAERIGCHW